ncbi:putative ribosome biogenesis protein-like protein [Hapsidospora chrysogenum ATCC 11550]|uniref:Putative ribosome biogenesis protein-like protein n=1 Tax=Hapsidospora chrysogenum (strain ATCC 11550 / CBS 779.69 / DSM 880 / IAM 14645 / JCM 23072 / IMI 49137) TaxID=857340 RepID=A0A086T7E4_HAPC1|nr:putative ribosome biogenesis protein-like protein [Hapsidospora chrysogenum ATCC 11550]
MPTKSDAVAKAVTPVVDPEQTLKASKALLSHIKKAAKQKADESSKRNLLSGPDGDDDDSVNETPVWLTLTSKRHITDKTKLQPGKIALPHPLNADETSTICLITADPQRAYKDIVASDEFPEALRKRVTRVVGLTKIKAKFSQYEAQRKLYSEHDIFLADDRIVNRLPKVLGKTFYKTTLKRPVPVVLQPKAPKVDGKRKRTKTEGQVRAGSPAQIAKEIEKALGSALVSLSPTTNTAVRVGYAGWTPEKIADNVRAVVDGLVGKWVPQGWNNVRGIYIKGPESAALPIWLTDELWVDEKDVIANDSAPAINAAEKANVGKKRKSIGEAEEAAAEEAEPAPKKKKSSKKEAKVPEGDDETLDKQISERKTRLRKQKAAAAKAMDD